MLKLNFKNFKFTLKKFIAIYLTVNLVILIFLSGLWVGQKILPGDSEFKAGKVYNKDSQPPEYLSKDVNFNLFWQVWDYVRNNYVKSDVYDTQLFYGALAGLVASLKDPYSVFLEPETTKKFQQELAGSFEGIGAEIGLRKEQLTIISPLPGSPAEKAGILAGDKIIAIDKQDTQNMALDYAVHLIRGKKGTTVVLTIFRNGESKPKDYSIIRDAIQIKSVSWKMEKGGIANIKLIYFNEDTWTDFNKAVTEILLKSPKGIILDLRGNPGGFLTTAIDIAGEWINGQPVVLEKLRSDEKISHRSAGKSRFEVIPTVVLVNGGSASGSEIVAGALQDYGVAKIVGEQTFGKGSVQDLKEFKGGSSVKLTIAEWLTPKGRGINEVGIAPDIEIEMTREDIDESRDPQLNKALEILGK